MIEPDFEKSSLLPAIAVDAESGKVLMLAYMNRDAYHETVNSRQVCYFSRSRNQLWRKGETSGNVQHLRRLFYDCDSDCLLLHVEQVGGAACHEGYESCFFRELNLDTSELEVIAERVFDPEEVYGKR